MREWRRRNLEKAREHGRKSYYKNREYYKAKAREYYHQHKEERREQIEEWRAKNPEKVEQYKRKYWLKWKEKLRELYDSFPNKCALCNKEFTDTKDKVLHEIHGKDHPRGTNRKAYEYLSKHRDDFRAICRRCHTATHFFMDVLGWTWEEIEEFVRREREKKESK